MASFQNDFIDFSGLFTQPQLVGGLWALKVGHRVSEGR